MSGCQATCQWALPHLPRSYELMRHTKTLLPISLPYTASLCRLLSALAGSWHFPTLSLKIFPRMPGPIPRLPLWCIYSLLPTGHRPSPHTHQVGASTKFPTVTSVGHDFRGCNHSLIFKPPGLLATQVTPTTAYIDAGQPSLLLPRISQFVTSLCSGYANRPNRAIDGMRTFTSLDSQPCRPLHVCIGIR